MPSQNWPIIGEKLYKDLAEKFPPRTVRSILLIVQAEILRERIGAAENEADRIFGEIKAEFNGLNGASAVINEALPHAKRAEKHARDAEKFV